VIESPSPDLSVARGAVIHHYNIVHDLVRTFSVLPDTISLEVGSGNFIPLVPSNTKYPTEQPIRLERIELTIPRDNIPYLDIPLWRGEHPHPTAKLLDRRINFREKSTSIKKGDILDLQISIDDNRQLILEAWLRDKPDVRFEVRSSVT
jgi:molecular chaperone DnaK (HSP70)